MCVEVQWMIPRESMRGELNVEDSMGRLIAHTMALHMLSVGGSPTLIPRDRGVCGIPLHRRFRTPQLEEE